MRLLVILILLFPTLALGGENCVSMGGVCRDRCSKDEAPIEGAFIDCDDKQDCCAATAGSSGTGRPAAQEIVPSPEPALDKDVH